VAKIRNIKPELCVSESLSRCSRDARLLFVLMGPFCDDNGVHPAKPGKLRMEVFPGDADLNAEKVETLIAELVTVGALVEFKHEGVCYLAIQGWEEHQRAGIKHHYSRFPAPPWGAYAPADTRTVPHGSTSPPGNGIGKGKGKGKGKKKKISDLEDPQSSSPKRDSTVADIFNHWRKVWGHPKAKLDSKRIHVIRAALKLVYDSISLLLRDAQHIEAGLQFAEQGTKRPAKTKPPTDEERFEAVLKWDMRQPQWVLDVVKSLGDFPVEESQRSDFLAAMAAARNGVRMHMIDADSVK
jgi:hypothetical protein